MKIRIGLGLVLLGAVCAAAGTEKRLVIIKVDGLPPGLVNQYVAERDPATGKSRLPWIDLIFRQHGATVENFYVRGISLSVPSWSELDTGRHLVIHGNVEYDRYTLRAYDYMNFFPFYVNYARSKRVDMPGVEVLDEAGVPLLIDRYTRAQRYQGLQLYQRGVYWKTLQGSLVHRITSRTPLQLFDEWQSGFEMRNGVSEEVERELKQKLFDPRVLYLDYFFGDYDHVAHLSNDPESQYLAIKQLDSLIGRIWTSIQLTPEANNTILVVVSDHGMNTSPEVYSQGYSLIDFFNSAAGGGHHVITNRHPMTEFKLKGLDPFVSEVTTPSSHSFYLRDQAGQYPTVLLDLDGNERACVHLRNNRLNEMQILLQQLARKDLAPAQRIADQRNFYRILDEQRPIWDSEIAGMRDELAALKRRIGRQETLVKSQPKKWTRAERDAGLDRDARREAARLRSWQEDYLEYSGYSRHLLHLLSIEPAQLDPLKISVQDLIPKRSMGDSNTIYDLQNYAVGPDADGNIRRLDYFALLTSLRVRNNVQAGVSSRPVDFIAVPVRKTFGPLADFDAVFIYQSEDSQALILSRQGPSGLELQYVPVRNLRQDRSGEIHYETRPMRAGLPLHMFEDPDLNVPGDRAAWLTAWHTDREWLEATHRTLYSNAVVGLHEELSSALPAPEEPPSTSDEILLRRFEVRKRANVQPDMLILASNHWNFNVRGFNPGGNHGSFFRISTHSVLMLAGAGIPPGMLIAQPYDSLSFAPTVLALANALRPGELKRFPGPLIEELVPKLTPDAPSAIGAASRSASRL